MKIWKLDVELQGFESFQLVNKDAVFLKKFRNKLSSGKSQNGELDNLEIEIIDSGQTSDLPKFWSFSGTLIFSDKAKMCLESLIKNSVEFIPIKLEQTTFYLVNILGIIDALDYEKVLLRKLDTGLIVGVEKHFFREDAINGVNLFKVLLNERIYYTEIFVTSEFKNKVEEAELVGFKFEEVWDSKKR